MDTTVITAAISVAAAMSGMVLGWLARAREVKKDIQNDVEATTAIRMDVTYIKHGVDDMRIELRSQGQRMDALAERVTRVEESAKQAHKRIDRIETEKG